MKKIVVDVDDVLALNTFLNALNVFGGTNYKYEDTEGYYIETMLSKEELVNFRNFMRTNNIYEFSRVAPYSKEVLMKLMVEGYDIYPTSKYYSDTDKIIIPELIPFKCEFLLKNYPFIPQKNYIFINDKSLLDADIRIDDCIGNLSNTGINLLFEAYHNKDIEEETLVEQNILRVKDWQDIEAKVLKKSIYK